MQDTSFLYGDQAPQHEDANDLGIDPNDVADMFDDESGRHFFGPDTDDGSMYVEHDSADTMVAMVDAHQVLGVSASDATRHVVNMLHRQRLARKPPFVEMYGVGNMVEMANGAARNLNVHGLSALVLRTYKPNGDRWDFTRRADRLEAVQVVED